MTRRMLTGVVSVVMTALAFGAVAAPEVSAVEKPQPKCVWIWTAGGSGCGLS